MIIARREFHKRIHTESHIGRKVINWCETNDEFNLYPIANANVINKQCDAVQNNIEWNEIRFFFRFVSCVYGCRRLYSCTERVQVTLKINEFNELTLNYLVAWVFVSRSTSLLKIQIIAFTAFLSIDIIHMRTHTHTHATSICVVGWSAGPPLNARQTDDSISECLLNRSCSIV